VKLRILNFRFVKETVVFQTEHKEKWQERRRIPPKAGLQQRENESLRKLYMYTDVTVQKYRLNRRLK
jgi:hypothetical protein